MGEAPVTGNVRKLIDDPSFPNQWTKIEDHLGHQVLRKEGVSKELNTHGRAVGVDFDICIADGICITVCPTNVFDRLDIPSEQARMDSGAPNDSGKASIALLAPGQQVPGIDLRPRLCLDSALVGNAPSKR